MEDNHTEDQQKRQGKYKRSEIIEQIRKEIETKTGKSIQELRKSYNYDARFYRICLIYVTATNEALCAAIGLRPDLGRLYFEAASKSNGAWKVDLVYCPFTGSMQYTLTTNPRNTRTCRRSI